MNRFIHRMLGHFLQNEAGAEGGQGGGAPATTPAADAPPAAAPAADAPAAQPAADPSAATAQDKPDDPTKPAVEGAPDAYSDFTTGEGFELDAAVLSDFQSLAKELNLSQASAQKLIDLQGKLEAARATGAQQAITAQAEAWAKAVENDAELGGEHFEATRETAAKAIQQFGSPELRQLLNETGLGNHPELVRFCQRIGKALSEDNLVLGGTQSGTGEMSIVDAFR